MGVMETKSVSSGLAHYRAASFAVAWGELAWRSRRLLPNVSPANGIGQLVWLHLEGVEGMDILVSYV